MGKESKEKNEQDEYIKNQKEEAQPEQKFNFNNLKILDEFKKIKNTFSDGIIPKIKHHKRFVNNSTKILIGEETELYNLNLGRTKNSKDLQTSNSALDATYISDKAKLLRRRINYHINKVKKSHEDLTLLNGLYLDNSLNHGKNSTSIMNSMSIVKSQEKTSNYGEAITKKKLMKNFDLITNNYHKRLKFAFSKYNPMTYLNDLKKLLLISPEVRHDVTKIKNDVDEDIKHLNNKKKFTKMFHKIKTTKNERNKGLDNFDSIINKSNDILKNFSLKNINDNENKKVILPILKEIKANTIRRDSTIKFGFLNKVRRKETRRLLDTKAHQYDEIKQLHNISKEIEKYIDNDNIDKKIDKNVQDFMEFKYLEIMQKRNGNNAKSTFKPKDYYKTQRNKIDELVGDLYIKNLRTKVQENARKLNKRLFINKNDYFNKMNSDMKSSLNEFDKNIVRNNINLDKK